MSCGAALIAMLKMIGNPYESHHAFPQDPFPNECRPLVLGSLLSRSLFILDATCSLAPSAFSGIDPQIYTVMHRNEADASLQRYVDLILAGVIRLGLMS